MRSLILLALCLAAASAEAAIQTTTVEYQSGGKTMKSYLAWDDAKEGKRPGIVIVPDWWGLGEQAKDSARRLAEQGYIAIAADMYGDGMTTVDPSVAGPLSDKKNDPEYVRQRFGDARAALVARPECDGDQIGAMGYCFGGTIALEAARMGLGIQAVASLHGGLKTNVAEAEWKLASKVLICHGDADPFVSKEEIETCKEGLRKAKADWEMNIYADAVHAFTWPQDPAKPVIPGAAYNEKAAKRSWEDLMDFFAETFKK